MERGRARQKSHRQKIIFQSGGSFRRRSSSPESTNSLNLEPHSLCVRRCQPARASGEKRKSQLGLIARKIFRAHNFFHISCACCWKRMQSVDGTRVENRDLGAPRPPGRRRRTRGLIVSHRGYRWHLFCAPLAHSLSLSLRLAPLLHLGRYIASSAAL